MRYFFCRTKRREYIETCKKKKLLILLVLGLGSPLLIGARGPLIILTEKSETL